MQDSVSVQVIGSGCPSCERLYRTVKEAVEEIGLRAEVEYVKDVRKIVELGLMSSPVLVVRGKPVSAGSVPNKDRVKELLLADAA